MTGVGSRHRPRRDWKPVAASVKTRLKDDDLCLSRYLHERRGEFISPLNDDDQANANDASFFPPHEHLPRKRTLLSTAVKHERVCYAIGPQFSFRFLPLPAFLRAVHGLRTGRGARTRLPEGTRIVGQTIPAFARPHSCSFDHLVGAGRLSRTPSRPRPSRRVQNHPVGQRRLQPEPCDIFALMPGEPSAEQASWAPGCLCVLSKLHVLFTRSLPREGDPSAGHRCRRRRSA